MPAMAELQSPDFLTPLDGAARVLSTNFELTEKGLHRFTKRLQNFARDRNYFEDTKVGNPRSVEGIYNLTQDLSAAVLLDDGLKGFEEVRVISPRLETRNKGFTKGAPADYAREYGMETVRLRAIIAMERSGALSEYRAMELAGGKEPWEALAEHQEKWDKFLNRSRSFQAENSQPSGIQKKNAVLYGESTPRLGKTRLDDTGERVVAVAAASVVSPRVMKLVAPFAISSIFLESCAPGIPTSTVELPQPGVTSGEQSVPTEVVIPTPPVTEQAPQGDTTPFKNLAETYLGASAGVRFDYNELQSIASGGDGTTGEISSADAAVFLENANVYLRNVNALLPSGHPPLETSNIVVFWNGKSEDLARNAPLAIRKVGGDTYVYWLYNKDTGELSQSPLYNTFGSDVNLGYRAVRVPSGTTQDNVQVLWNGEAMVVEGATTEALPEVLNLNPSSGEFEQLSMDEIAADESINIFDANTFPEKFRDIANNWLEASDEEWALYQEFVEASRAEFFEQEGIAAEVAGLKDINPNLQSLWGIIYWVQHNREQVIANQMMPVVTPSELRMILEDEPAFESWQEEKQVPEGRAIVFYGFGNLAFYPPFEYNSQTHGPILGRKDLVIPNRNPTDHAEGNLAIVARLFPDDPDVVVNLVHMRTPPEGTYPYENTLYADIVVLDDNFVVPAGTVCEASSGYGDTLDPEVLPLGIVLGPPKIGGGNRASLEEIIGSLGKNISISHNVGESVGGLNIISCQHPTVGLEIETEMRGFGTADLLDERFAPWPWQE